MPKELKLEYAVAVGEGSFPFDMLRHDQCFPTCEHCSWLLDGDENEGRRVVILARHSEQRGRWTSERWASFGWKLITWCNSTGFKRIEEAKAAEEKILKECKEV